MSKKTLFFTAACPSADATAASVMRALGSSNYNFVGIGGPQMQAQGLKSVGPTSDEFVNKVFFPYKNYVLRSTYLLHHPVHVVTRYFNYQVNKKLDAKKIYDEYNPQAFMTFGNELFMRQFYLKLRQNYKLLNVHCPPTFWWDMTHSNQYHLFQKYLDHCFSRINMQQLNHERFVFPHTQVGYDGVFDAYRHLFSRNSKYKHLTSQKGVLLLPAESERFPLQELVTELVNEERANFRKNHNIGESDTVIFLAGGNRPYEIKWSIPTVNKGLKQFLGLPELKNVPKESLCLVVSVPEFGEYKELTQQMIAKENFPFKVIQVTTQEQRFQGMAGADIGLAVNGQIVSECAALQLPTDFSQFQMLKDLIKLIGNNCTIASLTIQILQQKDISTRKNKILKVFDSELNLSSTPNVIATHLLQLYQDPKFRYYFIENYSQVLRESFARSNSQPTAEQEAAFPQTKLEAYQSASNAMAEQIEIGVKQYERLDKEYESGQQERERVRVFQELGWNKGL